MAEAAPTCRVPPIHLSAQAAMTPSGVPPMPIMMSTGPPALATCTGTSHSNFQLDALGSCQVCLCIRQHALPLIFAQVDQRRRSRCISRTPAALHTSWYKQLSNNRQTELAQHGPTEVGHLLTSMAPPTSPSLMRRMRAPASRHWRMSSACRGRSSIRTVTSL
jgi:hypothetical protein